jgi:hydrogenase maturation protein HypF
LPLEAPIPIVAVGGQLKNTVCLVQGRSAAVSEPIGDLSRSDAYRAFWALLQDVRADLGDGPALIAHDLHPTYASTLAASRLENQCHRWRRLGVQHHHAHIAACLAEHAMTGPVVGLAADGTGYGSDGRLWGCEILSARVATFDRRAHLEYFPLPGSDAAAIQTWRPALGLVHRAFGPDLPSHVHRLFDRVPERERQTAEAMLRSDLNCPLSPSLGRLFDAVAFLTCVGDANDTEGQAAIHLERSAGSCPGEPYSFRCEPEPPAERIGVCDMIRAICDDVHRSVPAGVIAARFHATVALMLSRSALQASREDGVVTVALSGGCFFNRLLTSRITDMLHEGGVEHVLNHEITSPGDASLALGQAYVATGHLQEAPTDVPGRTG